jgi:hypothetical protein
MLADIFNDDYYGEGKGENYKPEVPNDIDQELFDELAGEDWDNCTLGQGKCGKGEMPSPASLWTIHENLTDQKSPCWSVAYLEKEEKQEQR